MASSTQSNIKTVKSVSDSMKSTYLKNIMVTASDFIETVHFMQAKYSKILEDGKGTFIHNHKVTVHLAGESHEKNTYKYLRFVTKLETMSLCEEPGKEYIPCLPREWLRTMFNAKLVEVAGKQILVVCGSLSNFEPCESWKDVIPDDQKHVNALTREVDGEGADMIHEMYSDKMLDTWR